ncbi:CAP domain-containing protein [Lachnospiraceae bacterium C1.1]|nr:CAP domain-containing protein [Lachnospiraceae bacterium C1.1]
MNRRLVKKTVLMLTTTMFFSSAPAFINAEEKVQECLYFKTDEVYGAELNDNSSTYLTANETGSFMVDMGNGKTVQLSGELMSNASNILFVMLNQYRAANIGNNYCLSQLNEIDSLAESRAVEIAVNFSHLRPNASDSWQITVPEGMSISARAENLAYLMADGSDLQIANSLMSIWQNSYSHNKAMLNPAYNYASVAVFKSGGKYYAVQEFYRINN